MAKTKKQAERDKNAKAAHAEINKKLKEIKEIKDKHPGGRPTIYTKELADTILKRLAEGEYLEAICRDEDMPGVTAVFDWRSKHKEFAKGYSRARKRQAEILLDRSREVSEVGTKYAYEIPATVQDAAKANAIANMLKLQVGRYDHLAGCFNKKFAPHQNIKSKNENTNIQKENVPIEDRVNRINELVAKKKKISGEEK